MGYIPGSTACRRGAMSPEDVVKGLLPKWPEKRRSNVASAIVDALHGAGFLYTDRVQAVEINGGRVAIEHVEQYGLTIGLDAYGNASYVGSEWGLDVAEWIRSRVVAEAQAEEAEQTAESNPEPAVESPPEQAQPTMPRRCDHQTKDPGCLLPKCWGVPPLSTLFTGWRHIGDDAVPGEPGVYSVGRSIVDGVRRTLPGHTATHAMYGETPWDRDKTVRQVCAFRFVVGAQEVTVLAYQSRSALVADLHGYLAVYVDAELVAAGIRQSGQPSDYGRQVALAVEPKVRPAEPATPHIADVVRIRYAYEHGRTGERVDITDEAGARALVDRFGHALAVRPGGDGMSLLVATATERGPGGSYRLHDMACTAGLLPVIVGMAEWMTGAPVDATPVAANEERAPARVPGRWATLVTA